MSQLIKIKNAIRSFLRKQDEIFSPIFRFVWFLMVFMSLQKLFHYSDLGSKREVTFLLAVLSALLPDTFMFLITGVLIGLHCFSVSLEVGAVFLVIYILMYCVYIRFFPKYAYAMFIVPLFYILGIPYAAPIAVALIAGIGGMVPAVMGVVLYFFSQCVSDVSRLLATEDLENEIEAFKMLSDVLLHNKEMFAAMIIFAVTVLVIAILAKFSYPYAIYIAIAAGVIVNIFAAILAGYIIGEDVPLNMVMMNSLIGILLSFVIRIGQGLLDYGHTERVQFEDDDYFYYVKAVPKFDSEKKPKPGKKEAKQAAKQAAKTVTKPITQEDVIEELPADR
ncbi:MAG: hypothetical protein J5517_06140 [Eubacterium sp.]|nr:hypothetical protein [Eubacterium sp.]